MEFRPILSAMLRNKTGAILVGLQIALTLAVLANAVFIIVQRAEKIGREPGMDSANTFFVQSYGFGQGYNQRETVRRDLDMIRALPGVIAASPISGVPLSGGGASADYGISAVKGSQKISGNLYEIDEHGLEALGVRLAEGRSFTEAEIQYSEKPKAEFVPSVIVTRDLAKALYGDQPALGRNIYDIQGQSAVIVGIVDNMLGAWVDWDKLTQVIFHPRIHQGPIARYAVRAEPGRRDQLIAEVERKLATADISRAITWVRPHSFFTHRSYRADSRMIIFLCIMAGMIFIITAMGIVGLASFHVNIRTKQIGTRRAVGARRIDIIRYFMLENWLLTSGGAAAGAVMAFALGHWLSTAYALPRLQPVYVLAGIVTLWILGQLAVFVPARRAAAIPPAVATRTV